jgi:hypothetical protein
MTVLWMALGIYIIGVAVILYIRPSIMFRESGWKEFGLASTGNYTVFPFWMFTFAWAIVAYAMATLGAVFFASAALRSMPNADMQPISKSLPPVLQAPAVPQAPTPTPTQLPGYYVLDTPAMSAPKYVYYGTSPPTL